MINLFIYHVLTAGTLLLRLRFEGDIIQPRLVVRDGRACFNGYVQIIQGPGTKEAVQIVGCAVVLQRLGRLQSMS